MIRHRHLEYPLDTSVEQLGRAALDDLLDRGDLADWAPLARAIAAAPDGALADTVLALCEAHPMYGTSRLWRSWIEGLRDPVGRARSQSGPELRLGELRARRGLTQKAVGDTLGIPQSDVSKLERRADVRVSTLRRYVEATGGRLQLVGDYPGWSVTIVLGDRQS